MKPSRCAAGAAVLLFAASAASAQGYPYPGTGQPQPFGQPAYGQPSFAAPSITLYEGENFTGRQITIYGEERDFTRLGFNDRARSARTSESFLVCEDSYFRGRCERVTGAIRNLDRLGMSGRVSSAREDRGGDYDDPDDGGYEGPDRPDGGYGNPRRDGVEGRTVVFFARPTVSGNDVAARGQASADQFCRASGHGPAVYYSQGERSRRAVDRDGRLVEAPALRDVVCRRERRVY